MSSDAFERGYQAGYRAALQAAAAECRKHAEALDNGGNTYTRYGDAIRLSCVVLALLVPTTNEGDYIRDALQSVRDHGSATWDDWLIEKTDAALARVGAP